MWGLWTQNDPVGAGPGVCWGKKLLATKPKMFSLQRREEARTAFLSAHCFHQQFCSASCRKTTHCLSYLFLIGKATLEALVAELGAAFASWSVTHFQELHCILWGLKRLLMKERERES